LNNLETENAKLLEQLKSADTEYQNEKQKSFEDFIKLTTENSTIRTVQTTCLFIIRF